MDMGPASVRSVVPLWSGRLGLILAGSILLLSVFAWLAARSLQTLALRADWLNHTERVRYDIGRILQSITDIETGERGYVIAGNDAFLQPFRAARSDLDRELLALRQLTSDNPRQQALISTLTDIAHQRIEQAQAVIDKAAAADLTGARADIAAGEGRRTMDQARETVARMQDEEARLLSVRSAADARARATATALYVGLGALAIFLLGLIAFVTARDGARLHRTEHELAATLRSVGDAIISTDEQGIVRFLNPVAERLTGWTQREAGGRALEQVFHIINERTRALVESPVGKVMRQGTVVGLANHTVLIARDGSELPIEDSGAPVFATNGMLAGVVLVFRDATLEREAQRAIAISEQRFRGAIAAIEGVLWTNSAEGEMRGEQPGWAALTGQSAAEYQGFGWANAVHPEDAQPTIDAWLEAVRTKQPFRFEHRVRERSGQWRSFSIHAIPVLEPSGAVREWVGVHTDVTEQRQFESQLRERERRFAALANSIPQLAWTNRADGTQEFFNRQWYQYTGLTPTESVRLDVWEKVVHGEDFPHSSKLWMEVLRTGAPYEAEFRLRRYDGIYRWFLARANADRDDNGNIIEWFGTCTDVDASKRTQEELRRTEASLREADVRKDVFLATLSHELRNPLAPIRTAARLLELPTLSREEFERSRAIITRQVRHMASLLEDLMDVARITRGALTLRKQSINVQQRVAEAIETVQPALEAKNQRLELELPSDPIEIEADPVRLVQVVANLLANAAKYTPDGGYVALRAQLQDQWLLLSVRDSGIGLAPEHLSRVFEMFTRISASTDRTEGGLGIGLALVKGLVDLHGGRVEAYSEGIGRGSEFRVLLPRARSAQIRRADGDQPLRDRLSPAAGLRVLIADDNRDAAETLGMLLSVAGYQVEICHSGSEAVSRIARSRPEVAILDIGMPGMNGFEVAKAVRAQPGGDGIHLIALTGWGQEEDQRASRSAGFDRHLTKPVDLPELEQVIASLSGSGRVTAL
jgi:PAS domain S-box-containing protein